MMISVAMCTYNGDHYVREQLDSIAKQSYPVDEIVIVDDCSTDATLEEIKKFNKSSNIEINVVAHKKNCGVISSFQEAISRTHGDVIFLCDQDDVWLPNKVDLYIKTFNGNANKNKLVFSNSIVTDQNLNKTGMLWDQLNFSYETLKNKNDIFTEMLKRNIVTGMSLAFERNLLVNTIFSTHMLHDESLAWAALFTGTIIPLNTATAYYRQHINNSVGFQRKKFISVNNTKSIVKHRLIDRVGKLEDILNYPMDDKHKDIMQECMSFNSWRLSLYTSRRKEIVTLINNIRRAKYKKYTSKTENAIVKDLMCIIF